MKYSKYDRGLCTVITGGTSGIGRAIVKRILEGSEDERDRIFVNYGHDDALAGSLLEELGEEGRKKVMLVKADMSSYDGIGELVSQVLEETDGIDRLILNTGISSYLPFDEYTTALWDEIMMTNVNVPAFTVQAFKPHMNEGGCILFMGSHAGQAPYSSSVVYSTSKAALMFLAKSLVKVFDEQGVRVNAVAPGFIETRWQDNRSQESRDRINRKIAAHRFGTPEEVADLRWEILNNDYLNGSIYDIHGGYDYF